MSEKSVATAKGVKRPRPSSGKSKEKPSLNLPMKLIEKYARGSVNFNTKSLKYKRLRKTMQETQERIVEAATASAAAEILLPSTPGCITLDNPNDKTFKLRQTEIKKNIDLNSAKNIMDLHLQSFGPYRVNYSRNGRFLLFSGNRGHVAVMDCLRFAVGAEMQLQQTVFDAKFLHNDTLFATAQEKYTYIYDHKGTEIHCIKRHERPYRLDYLPYHFLLTTVGHSGWIKWHDISTGEFVSGHSAGHGPTHVLKHNPTNAVSHLGHTNGVVTLWSPTSAKALVSMFCHKGPITDLSIDREGHYMSTASLDGLLKVWDLRKYTLLQTYKTEHPVNSLDYSERGLLAMGLGRAVQMLREVHSRPGDMTYLTHTVTTPSLALPGGGSVTARTNALASSLSVSSVCFRPLEDVLAIGHSHGVSTIVVPGSGEANFDSFENNPFMNPKQRREYEVQNLLNKLRHDMIGLDSSFIGSVDVNPEELVKERREMAALANQNIEDKKGKDKDRKRGRNKIAAKLRRKQKNVIDAQTVKLKEKLQKDREEREQRRSGQVVPEPLQNESAALRRFT